jgi:hypothetical protein
VHRPAYNRSRGEGAVSLAPARVIEAMRAVQSEGLVRNIGARLGTLTWSAAPSGPVLVRRTLLQRCRVRQPQVPGGAGSMARSTRQAPATWGLSARVCGGACGVVDGGYRRWVGGGPHSRADYESDVQRAQRLMAWRGLGMENVMEMSLRFVMAKRASRRPSSDTRTETSSRMRFGGQNAAASGGRGA